MINILYRVFKWLAIAIFLLMLFVWLPFNRQTYKVELTFCDGRDKRVIYVDAHFPPNNSDIATHNLSVPKYEGHLNVCDIKVLEVIEQIEKKYESYTYTVGLRRK